MNCFNHPFVEIKYGKYGRGLYAKTHLLKDTVIEQAPFIEIPECENELIDSTILNNYTFSQDLNKVSKQCLVLGVSSLFNHNPNTNNVGVRRETILIEDTMNSSQKKEIEVFVFFLKQNVNIGEELCIDYGYDISHINKKYLGKRKKNLAIISKK